MMENYSRSLGKKNISISNDKVSTSSYGSKTLTATATNHSNKTFDHVSIQFIFYKGNSVVGTASDYLYYLGPNQSAKIDASMYDIDSYDRYELDYISASE